MRTQLMRRIARASLGVAASVLVGLLLCELLSRVYAHVRCVPQNGAVNRFDRFYGWGNRPGVDVEMTNCVPGAKEYAVEVTVDPRGFRGREQPPGDRRVLVLGDSFTAGMQVADDEVYPHLLADEIERQKLLP